jgi:hypothetical protein
VSTVERDLEVVVSVLLALPILAVVALAVLDVIRRTDLPRVRKVAYGAAVVLFSPAAVLYLLSRPTSLVRHRDRSRPDWRGDLVARLTAPPGAPPTVGPRQEQLLLEQVLERTQPG